MTKVQKDPVIGQKFGYLTVTEVTRKGNSTKGWQKKVLAVCVCGVIKEYFLCNLRKEAHTLSCGCKKGELISQNRRTHGGTSNGTRTLLYGVWCAIRDRCSNPKNKRYAKYGGSGVRICDEWDASYVSFRDWCLANGWKPGMQVDKDKKAREMDVPALLYSPEMCSILTCKENNNERGENIRISYNGELVTISKLAELTGHSYRLLWERIFKRKWSIEKAINTPKLGPNGRHDKPNPDSIPDRPPS